MGNETNKLQARRKYPLLLEIHGGPAAMWGPGQESMWHEYQFFVVGYGIVYSNPRGSLRLRFLRANINDWGKVLPDVLTALDKLLMKAGLTKIIY
jgi:dipeptidyl aminopeptidase/acylaminoacyl peptidase